MLKLCPFLVLVPALVLVLILVLVLVPVLVPVTHGQGDWLTWYMLQRPTCEGVSNMIFQI